MPTLAELFRFIVRLCSARVGLCSARVSDPAETPDRQVSSSNRTQRHEFWARKRETRGTHQDIAID